MGKQLEGNTGLLEGVVGFWCFFWSDTVNEKRVMNFSLLKLFSF